MLGMTLVTHQTGPEGKEVKRVYIEEGADIARELYLGMLVDRNTGRVTVMASTEGGMEIEEVAEKTPEKILTATIDPATGLQAFHRSEEHTSELQSLMRISYAVFCLKKTRKQQT